MKTATKINQLGAALSLLVTLASCQQGAAADWEFHAVGWGQNVANYSSLAVTSLGWWSVAYDDSAAGLLKCAILTADGRGYTIETVMNGGAGASVAYSPAGNVSISHVYGTKLYFVSKVGSSWTSKQIESKDVNRGDTSLAFDGAGRTCISYFKTGRSAGLWFASGKGSSWSTQRVDPNAYAVYNQLVVDPSGNPAIAYSDDADGDGTVDTLKVAHWNGAVWEIGAVDAGGLFATLAYDPLSGNLAVAHWNAAAGQLRFRMWNGTGWSDPEIVDPTATSATGCSLDFHSDGTACVAFSAPELRLAQRDASSGLWTVQVIDPAAPGSARSSVKAGRFLPSVAYRGADYLGYYPTSAQLAIQRTP